MYLEQRPSVPYRPVREPSVQGLGAGDQPECQFRHPAPPTLKAQWRVLLLDRRVLPSPTHGGSDPREPELAGGQEAPQYRDLEPVVQGHLRPRRLLFLEVEP